MDWRTMLTELQAEDIIISVRQDASNVQLMATDFDTRWQAGQKKPARKASNR